MKIELYIHVSIRKGNHDYLVIRILVYCENGAPLKQTTFKQGSYYITNLKINFTFLSNHDYLSM